MKRKCLDINIIQERLYSSFKLLTVQCCVYTKTMINDYMESLWQSSVEMKLHSIGETRVPRVSTKQISMPLSTPRQTEVIVLSFLYKQNLLNGFLYLAQRKKCTSPICDCGIEEQTAHHFVASCELVDGRLRSEVGKVLVSCNNMNEPPPDYISLLNCSRDDSFIKLCIDIVNGNRSRLRSKYTIIRNY